MFENNASYLSKSDTSIIPALRGAAVAALLVIGVAVPAHAEPLTAVERADMTRLIEQARPLSELSVSPEMQALIAEFVDRSIRMSATDLAGDAEAIGIIAQDRTRALSALAFHPPRNLVELAAKLAVLVEFSEDVERFALRAVVEDANRLVEGAK
jgi:hypothetical protein